MSLAYRPEIDGLRCLAVVAVFVFHLKRQWLPGGYLGVDIFFVISGFLISQTLLSDAAEGISLRRFYQRRIAHILPASFGVALLALAAAALVYQPRNLAGACTSFASASMFVQNLALTKEDDYFEALNDTQPFLHCWSLSVEEQF
ncbi:MAG: acyltransferase [Verrucomicrobia bacterium]|nr:acyltransferase [Verrucomicrobiota bacterium]